MIRLEDGNEAWTNPSGKNMKDQSMISKILNLAVSCMIFGNS